MKPIPVAYHQEVRRIVDDIVKNYNPEKIILFGSAATGKLHENSDIDLLIIKNTKERYWDRVKRVALMLNTWYPTDIFVLTPKELDTAIAQNRFFLTYEILPKGKVIYEKRQKIPS